MSLHKTNEFNLQFAIRELQMYEIKVRNKSDVWLIVFRSLPHCPLVAFSTCIKSKICKVS